MRFEPMTSEIPVQRSTNWANKPTGSWSMCWVQINHPSDEWWFKIYEIHIPVFALRWSYEVLTFWAFRKKLMNRELVATPGSWQTDCKYLSRWTRLSSTCAGVKDRSFLGGNFATILGPNSLRNWKKNNKKKTQS